MPAIFRTVALGIGLLGGALTSQLPEFAQQYVQRLGGAVDELRLFVESFDRDARAGGLDRPAALRRMLDNADGFVRDRGAAAAVTIARHDKLALHYTALRESSGVGRMWQLTGADPDIARRTASDYVPAVPFSLDGIVAALTGFAAGLALVAGGSRVIQRLRRRKTPAAPQARG